MEKDIDKLQSIIKADTTTLSLLDLAGQPLINVASTYIAEQQKAGRTVSFETACSIIIAKRIIKRSKWDDLASSEKRLCMYFCPSRPTRNDILFEEVIEIDCHVPASLDYMARRTVDRVINLLNNRRINGRYLKLKGSLGELPTATGFYCCGVRFGYYNPV